MSFFGKLFGGKKKNDLSSSPQGLLNELVINLLKHSGLELSFEIQRSESEALLVDFFGKDEEYLTNKEGQLLDAFQLFLKRVVQHQFPDEKVSVDVDCADFRKQANQDLIDMADKLKEMAVNKGRSVYIRALAPKDRKFIHQYLAEDGRVRSRSVGEGHFKKIKIIPTKEIAEAASDQP
ncbi:MAG: hypothetical protein K1X29_01040 [Bdellovibrionales bacterium]|nr:hypothetical protein [Bdellovibrionales bacterium]